MSNKNHIFALQLKKMASKYPSYSIINEMNFHSDTLKQHLLYIASNDAIDSQSTIDFIRSSINMNDLNTVDNMIYDVNLSMKQKLSLKNIYDCLFTILNGNEVSIKLSDLEYVGYFDTSDISDPVPLGM